MAFCMSRGRGLHSSQRYLSGASFSSYTPTHAPCCHTEHLSQKMVNPSSSSMPHMPSHVSLFNVGGWVYIVLCPCLRETVDLREGILGLRLVMGEGLLYGVGCGCGGRGCGVFLRGKHCRLA